MKKAILIWAFVAVTLGALVLGYVQDRPVIREPLVVAPAPLLPKKVDEVHLAGNSMEPFFHDDTIIAVYEKPVPKPGDSIVFLCHVEKCNYRKLHKFLIATKDECIWVQGTSPNSLDSIDYGWLCGEEYTLIGITNK